MPSVAVAVAVSAVLPPLLPGSGCRRAAPQRFAVIDVQERARPVTVAASVTDNGENIGIWPSVFLSRSPPYVWPPPAIRRAVGGCFCMRCTPSR